MARVLDLFAVRERGETANADIYSNGPSGRRQRLRLGRLVNEDLIADPRESVERAVSSLLPELVPSADAVIPSFSDLHGVDPLFFRRGVAHSHRDEMPDELHELFWAQPENATAMRLLRYDERPVQNLAWRDCL